jgi:hypothetical protein
MVDGAYVANGISLRVSERTSVSSEPITLNITKEESEEKTAKAEVQKFGAFAVTIKDEIDIKKMLPKNCRHFHAVLKSFRFNIHKIELTLIKCDNSIFWVEWIWCKIILKFVLS